MGELIAGLVYSVIGFGIAAASIFGVGVIIKKLRSKHTKKTKNNQQRTPKSKGDIAIEKTKDEQPEPNLQHSINETLHNKNKNNIDSSNLNITT